MTRTQWIEQVKRGCGYSCPYRDVLSGKCERHGQSATDAIVERVTQAFRRDVQRIMEGSAR